MTAASRSGVTVLIAEDSRVQGQILSEKLREAGFAVRLAADGAIALASARAERPTVVISDIEMPNMTGYELCSALKADPDLRSVPFILLSTLSEPQDIIRGLHCGADNYVTKPYDAEFLISRVDSLLTTPLGDDGTEEELEVTLAGERYTVNSSRQHVLNLLMSTFENAVEKNRELLRTNEELTRVKEQLTAWNQKLETLNEELDTANKRTKRELDAAARVQQSLLPSAELDTVRATCAWKYLPCDELAGDFLNYFLLDERHVAVYVVDVCGHGVAAALLAVTIGRLLTPRAGSSSLVLEWHEEESRIVPPLEVALELNRRLPMEEQDGLWFTMVYGILDLDTLEFRHVRAGHPEVVHTPADGPPTTLKCAGMPIGCIDEIQLEEHVVTLEEGDRLLLYSDGIPEAMNPNGDLLGMQQLLELIELGKAQPIHDNVDLIMDVVARWCAERGPDDDLTVLALEIAPAGV
jgi:sigma-B regulation protein RsbU (phosphoserine phosphatase)